MDDINIIISREDVFNDDIPNIGKEKLKNVNWVTLPTIDFRKIYSKEVKESLEKIINLYYHYCIFLSSNSVHLFFEIANDQKKLTETLHALSKIKIVVIGPKTKETLKKYGIDSEEAYNHRNNNYSVVNIKDFLYKLDLENKNRLDLLRILIPRSAQSIRSNNFINTNFESIELNQVFFYDICEKKDVSNSSEWKKLNELSKYSDKTFLIFTSPSTVRSFFKIIYQLLPQYSDSKSEMDVIHDLKVHKVISIGPMTSRALIEKKIDHIESPVHTVKGTLEAVFELV